MHRCAKAGHLFVVVMASAIAAVFSGFEPIACRLGEVSHWRAMPGDAGSGAGDGNGAEGGSSNLRIHAHDRHELRHQVMLL